MSFKGTVARSRVQGKVLPAEGSSCIDTWVKYWPGAGRRAWTFDRGWMTLAGLCVFLCVHVQDSHKACGPRRTGHSGILQTFVGHLPPTAPGAGPLWPEASPLHGDSCASAVPTDTTRSFRTRRRAGCPLPQRRPRRGPLCPPSSLVSVCNSKCASTWSALVSWDSGMLPCAGEFSPDLGLCNQA